jgi:competence protein CoiA
MQILAKTKNNTLITVSRAEKKENYFCLECNEILHKRSGVYQQEHFYHVKPTLNCRQNNKSIEHIQTQIFIKKLFIDQNCHMEYRFNSINRIADLYVEDLSLVIEIQCSFISLKEVQTRISDYAKLGLKVLWIFHEKKFNKKTKTPVEVFLKNQTYYYTNINNEGQGMIFDSYFFSKKRSIDLGCYLQFPRYLPKDFLLLKRRKKKLPFYFKGDLSFLVLNEKNHELIQKIKGYRSKKLLHFLIQCSMHIKDWFYLTLEKALK